MADPSNPGQFGNRQDTKPRASEGGSASSGNLKNDPQRASDMGKKGADAQSKEDKAEGGRHSSGNQYTS